MAEKKLVQVLTNPEPKSKVTKYNPEVSDTSLPLPGIYVRKLNLAEIGSPTKIKVTIEAA